MGLRFRKSVNLGGGFRVNLSKSGVGASWGCKGYRITKTAKGTTRKTVSLPGTGISYVDETSVKKEDAGIENSNDVDETSTKKEDANMENPNMVYCPTCGKEMARTASACPNCGAPNPAFNSGISPKSRTVCLLLCIFLGCIGIHKFYVGKTGMGILYICTCWFGLSLILAIIDFIMILCGSFKDKDGLPVKTW